jgi:uncharacterized protein YcbK (DUF882 family)
MLPSKNFKRSEFACKCGCGFDVVDAELLNLLEFVRESIYCNTPMNISSGNRCPKHNLKEKGEVGSKHLEAEAVDVHNDFKTPEYVLKQFNKLFPDKYGFGIYDWGVHIDIHPGHARRWDRRSNKRKRKIKVILKMKEAK